MILLLAGFLPYKGKFGVVLSGLQPPSLPYYPNDMFLLNKEDCKKILFGKSLYSTLASDFRLLQYLFMLSYYLLYCTMSCVVLQAMFTTANCNHHYKAIRGVRFYIIRGVAFISLPLKVLYLPLHQQLLLCMLRPQLSLSAFENEWKAFINPKVYVLWRNRHVTCNTLNGVAICFMVSLVIIPNGVINYTLRETCLQATGCWNRSCQMMHHNDLKYNQEIVPHLWSQKHKMFTYM